MMTIQRNKLGRMLFNPEFHGNHKKAWMVQDEQYLIDHYEALGPEHCAFALEKTIQSVMQRVCEMRKAGRMNKPTKRSHFKRVK